MSDLPTKTLSPAERRGGVHFFSATAAREAFVAQQLQLLADSNFGGSLTPLLSMLVDNIKLNSKDHEVIRRIIEKIE